MNTNKKLVATDPVLLKKADINFLLKQYTDNIRKMVVSDRTQIAKDPEATLSPIEYAFHAGGAYMLRSILTLYCGFKVNELEELEERIQEEVREESIPVDNFDLIKHDIQ